MSREKNPPPNFGTDNWFHPMSVDLILKVLNITFLHPFIAWLIPLCLRAQTTHWNAPPMVASIAWATVVTAGCCLAWLSRRVAYGLPREVDLEDEVIVITGGASGLGMLVAEVYGMRGATVAVLDVNEMENGEARGVTCYKCDVSDREAVEKVAKEIEKEVSTARV